MMAFNLALADCGLSDMGYVGNTFTWSNNHDVPRTIRCRLDRVCATQSALQRFPTAFVTNLEHAGSDHLPIWLQLERPIRPGRGPRSRPFCFESMWVRRNDCEEIIRTEVANNNFV